VAAGVWLGAARPGDVLEIVSDDRAFDAVGDVATSLGISFRRLSYRGLSDQPRAAEPEPVAAHREGSSGGRRGGRHRRGHGGRGRYDRPAPQPQVHVAPPAPSEAEPHTAPHDELLDIARGLIHQSPTQAVTLDTLANALKARGFSRPPGSPRLITRLRRIRELQVSRSGQITLVDSESAQPWTPPASPVTQPALPPMPTTAPLAPVTTPTAAQTYEDRRAEVEAAQRGELVSPSRAPVTDDDTASSDEPTAVEEAPAGDAPRRRRSRRGGRRRRRHRAPAAG